MDCIELLRELIGFDTVNPPGNEKPAARYLAGILEPMGFKCEVQDLGGSRANLIAVLDGGAGPELMLNGHLLWESGTAVPFPWKKRMESFTAGEPAT